MEESFGSDTLGSLEETEYNDDTVSLGKYLEIYKSLIKSKYKSSLRADSKTTVTPEKE